MTKTNVINVCKISISKSNALNDEKSSKSTPFVGAALASGSCWEAI